MKDLRTDLLALHYSKVNNNQQEIQQKLIQRTLRYATENVPYYSSFCSHGNSSLELSSFPVVDKQLIRKNPDLFTSRKKDHILYHEALTGGTTGEPFRFLLSNAADGFYQIKLWKRCGYKRGQRILAMDGTVLTTEQQQRGDFGGVRKPSRVYMSDQLPYGGFFLSSLYYTDENSKKYLELFQQAAPDFIRGYPSFVYLFGQYIISQHVTLKKPIRCIELTSEAWYEYQIDLIKEAYQCDHIVFQYGHSECSVFGYTFDNTYAYKTEPLYGYTEVLKEDGSPAEPGETGEIIVTSFYNDVMPFIRYRTGDYAVVGKPQNGEQILTKILGRKQDYLYDPEGTPLALTGLIPGHEFTPYNHIEKWQLEQSIPGTVEIRIIKREGYSHSDEDYIIRFFKENGNIDASISYVDEIPLTSRGKSLLLIQHISPQAESGK
ncbi:phenylacetate--CoA ligase family protein [Galactobacillus timonensis]|uniref:phenylacetate--CoA ligase family protein n=1 Tax=Galactobacillus timonensis TaxID=2041840 RepID=UPI000C82799B|nr:phenylacetate--CoA ligase family protein [Galactobacillus timonensis]